MEASDKKWMIIGGVIVLSVSSSMLFWRIPTVYTPFPFYLFLLAWVLGYFSILVMPSIFVFLCYKFHNSNKYLTGHFVAVVVLAILSLPYFYQSWEYGIKYQGIEHTKIIASQNAAIFLGLLMLSTWAFIRKSKPASYLVSIFLFSFLSWGAFPYLGELP